MVDMGLFGELIKFQLFHHSHELEKMGFSTAQPIKRGEPLGLLPYLLIIHILAGFSGSGG